jgi:hypothetical protein
MLSLEDTCLHQRGSHFGTWLHPHLFDIHYQQWRVEARRSGRPELYEGRRGRHLRL